MDNKYVTESDTPEVQGATTEPILEFRCKDYPEANGRKAIVGEQSYALTFPLEDGRKLIVHQGQEGMNVFASMLSQMMVDDAEGKTESTPMHEPSPIPLSVESAKEVGNSGPYGLPYREAARNYPGGGFSIKQVVSCTNELGTQEVAGLPNLAAGDATTISETIQGGSKCGYCSDYGCQSCEPIEYEKCIHCGFERKDHISGLSCGSRYQLHFTPDNSSLSVESAEPNGVALIAAERQRQVDKEGWTPAHDDEHESCELTYAASAYLQVAPTALYGGDVTRTHANGTWPWDSKLWKPSDDPIRNLVKAGALTAAEIDRLQRLRSKAQ